MQIINVPLQAAPCSCNGVCGSCTARQNLSSLRGLRGLGNVNQIVSSLEKQKFDQNVESIMVHFVKTWTLRRNLVLLSIAIRETGQNPVKSDIDAFNKARADLFEAAYALDGIINSITAQGNPEGIAYVTKSLGDINKVISDVGYSGISSMSFATIFGVMIPELPLFVTVPASTPQTQGEMKRELSFYGFKNVDLAGNWLTWTAVGVGSAAIAASVGCAAAIIATAGTAGAAAPVAVLACSLAKFAIGGAVVFGIGAAAYSAYNNTIQQSVNKINAQSAALDTAVKATRDCMNIPNIDPETCKVLMSKVSQQGFFDPAEPKGVTDAIDSLTKFAIALGIFGIGFMLFKSGVFSAGAKAIEARTMNYQQLPEGRVVETSLSPMAGLRKRRRVSRRRRYA